MSVVPKQTSAVLRHDLIPHDTGVVCEAGSERRLVVVGEDVFRSASMRCTVESLFGTNSITPLGARPVRIEMDVRLRPGITAAPEEGAVSSMSVLMVLDRGYHGVLTLEW